ncbi:hypothetical protein [Flavobacterium aquidurense]|uniref:hypothetical protein n=1 Tax=Flavobacterium aquidurense TaxID=362413 RepID=UPI00285D9726|nr:hypothetical protein [Flavobacterium aquidurense]MDR7371068.1 hypothetical protein [Flavobacterium aquidurense]
MKTLILKNIAPFAVIVMGVSGAFLTTSMQSAPKSTLPNGYIFSGNKCNVEVNCSNISTNPVCRQGGDTGPQAFGKDGEDNCNVELYKPSNP